MMHSHDDIPAELAANLAAYRTPRALAEFSSYWLHDDEQDVLPRYFKSGQRVLDLACGLGRTTLLLHEMGLTVRGVDRSDVFIEVAQRRFPYLDLRVGSYDQIDEPHSSWPNVLISFNGIDYAFPQTQRTAALRECVRVLQPGGTLIFSSHNIKSLHWFSPYYRHQLRWKLRNCLKAYKDCAYILEDGVYTFYAAPHIVIRQAEALGLELVERRGFMKFASRKVDDYFSPYLLYVFRKPGPESGSQ